jgi:AraC family transcriptional regulator, regulatory protein of adaptative response / DNA-3-methyladenine glycosylase II
VDRTTGNPTQTEMVDRDGRFPPGSRVGPRHDGRVPQLDPDQCYVAVQSRDPRFDGWFVTAVRTTGIYCRPSCPAITPKRSNVDFFPTAAAAQQRGFRACKRCRPDASPGSPDWNVRHDVVARAMRLIADGVVEREGVGGLARRLGYSERHLNRVFTDELGAGPLAVARAQRAHTARLLIETTSLTSTDVAFAAGFGSVRQFNDTVRDVFGVSPTQLRAASTRNAASDLVTTGATGSVSLRLPVRAPFASSEVMSFVGNRAIPGIESWDGVTYRRSLDLPAGPGLVELVARDDHVAARLGLSSWRDLGVAVQRIRRLLDLDSDPAAVDAVLGSDPALAELVRSAPGRRAPASVDPYETAIRGVVGQQVSVAGARTVAGRFVRQVGRRLAEPIGDVTHVFPRPDELADAPDDAFSMPGARRDTIRRLAAAVAVGHLELDAGSDPAVARLQLLALEGVGPWTADYVVMRGLGHPDTFLASDLGVRHGLARLGVDVARAGRWAPWRSYAVHHLWAGLAVLPAPPPQRTDRRTNADRRTKADR